MKPPSRPSVGRHKTSDRWRQDDRRQRRSASYANLQSSRRSQPQPLQFFATAAQGIEPIVADELRALGANNIKEARGGVSFTGPLSTAYRACLWLRTANRVLLPLARFPAADADVLYTAIKRMPWENDLSPDGTLAVDFTGVSEKIIHTQFGAQRVKDGIVDRFRERSGQRPSVDLEDPDLRINVHLHREIATVSLDLSGNSLHQRGYRVRGVAAPLKENLAAALLLKCGWLEIAKQGGAFADPMCGSGTLVIEAALIAGDTAPGLLRTRWGFDGWRKHDPQLWEHLLTEARTRSQVGRAVIPPILGFDHDPKALAASQTNAEQAGLKDVIQLECRTLANSRLPSGLAPGLVVTNPPYGERLGEVETLGPVYAELGSWLKNQCSGWKAGVITGNPELAKQMRIRARKLNAFYNGAIECKLLQFDIRPERFMRVSDTAATG